MEWLLEVSTIPKHKVLGCHAGSAGLFSTVADLERFLEHYLKDDFARDLSQNLRVKRARPALSDGI